MRKSAVLVSILPLLLLGGCDYSDGVKPGQSHQPVAEVQQNNEAKGGGADTGISLRDRVNSFERSVGELQERIEDGANAPELEQKARRLADKSAPILDGFSEENPDCTDYLSEAKGLVGMLGNISEGEIRRHYLNGESLPSAPSKCSEPKNLLVRPATMVVMLKNETSREALTGEIEKLATDVRRFKNNL